MEEIKIKTLKLLKNESEALKFFDITPDDTLRELKRRVFQYRMCYTYIGNAPINTLKRVLSLSNEFNFEYPFNLLKAIFGNIDEEYIDNVIDNINIINNFLIKALHTLTEREQEVLRYRFSCKETLKEVGKHFNIQKERTRQIEAKALRKLRNPMRSRNIRIMTEIKNYDKETQKAIYAYIAEINPIACRIVDNLCDIYEYKNRQLQLIIEEVFIRDLLTTEYPDKIILKAIGLYKEHRDTETIDLGTVVIEDLDISVRSFNAMYRHGIRTIDDIIESMEEESFLHIKNLGKRSEKEVIEKLISVGLKDRIPESILTWYNVNTYI